MADIADYAADQQDYLNEVALSRTQQASRLRPKGRCHNCEEPLTDTLLFCDGFCRDDWSKRQDARKRNGV